LLRKKERASEGECVDCRKRGGTCGGQKKRDWERESERLGKKERARARERGGKERKSTESGLLGGPLPLLFSRSLILIFSLFYFFLSLSLSVACCVTTVIPL